MDDNGLVLKKDSSILGFLKKYGGIVLVILILIAIFILARLAFPQLLSFTQKKAATDSSKSVSLNPDKKEIIVASSQHKNYSLILSNSNSLRDYFKKLEIWGKTYNEKVQKNTKPLNVVFIFLTDKKDQVAQVVDAKGKEIFSYSLVFNVDTLMITICLSDEVLSSNDSAEVFGNAVGYVASVIHGSKFPKGSFPNNSVTDKLFQISKREQIGPTLSPEKINKIINSVGPKK